MEHIHPMQNIIADELSKIVAKSLPVPPGTFVGYLMALSVKPIAGKASFPADVPEKPTASRWNSAVEEFVEGTVPGKHHVMYLEGSSPPWAGDTIRYVRDGVLPEDDSVAEWVAPREKMFRLID
jgi:hypothetical protein